MRGRTIALDRSAWIMAVFLHTALLLMVTVTMDHRPPKPWMPGAVVEVALISPRTVPPSPRRPMVMTPSLPSASSPPSSDVVPQPDATPEDGASQAPLPTPGPTPIAKQSNTSTPPLEPVIPAVTPPRPTPKRRAKVKNRHKRHRVKRQTPRTSRRAATSSPARPGNAQVASSSADAQASGQIGTASGPLQLPNLKSAYRTNPKPRYPISARRRGLEGMVLLGVSIDAGGRPVRVWVKRSSGHGILDRAALRSVQKWRFLPALRANVPVPARLEVPIRFRLRGRG